MGLFQIAHADFTYHVIFLGGKNLKMKLASVELPLNLFQTHTRRHRRQKFLVFLFLI